MIPNRSFAPPELSPLEFYVDRWRRGMDTHAIAAAATVYFGTPINEASVVRLLVRWRDGKAKS